MLHSFSMTTRRRSSSTNFDFSQASLVCVGGEWTHIKTHELLPRRYHLLPLSLHRNHAIKLQQLVGSLGILFLYIYIVTINK